MKIAIPTQSISKSLFIAKRKDRNDLELLFMHLQVLMKHFLN